MDNLIQIHILFMLSIVILQIQYLGYLFCFRWSLLLGVNIKKRIIHDLNMSNIELGKKIKLENCFIRKIRDDYLIFRSSKYPFSTQLYHKVCIKKYKNDFYLVWNYSIIFFLGFLYATVFMIMIYFVFLINSIILFAILIFISTLSNYLTFKYVKKREKDFLDNSIKEIIQYAKET